MKKIKSIIFTVCVLICVIIILLVILLNVNNSESNNQNHLVGEVNIEFETDSTIKSVSKRTEYYIVQTCTNKFYQFYMGIYDTDNDEIYIDNSEEEQENITSQYKQAVYSMLDDEYIKANQITEENIGTKLEKISNSYIDITKIYVSEQTNNISVYIVSGNLRNEKTSEITNFQIMLKIDTINRTFKVLLHDYIEQNYKNLQVGQEIDFNVPEKIESSGTNIFEYSSKSDEDYISDLFNKFKNQILYNKELVYNNYIEETYKKSKFGTQNKFNEYVKNNIISIVSAKLDKYKKTTTDSYTQYVCIDQNGKYYIFRETAPMNYTVILDTYTIDLPEFVEEYEPATDENKVLLNIQKCFDAINDKDYKYVYNKLDNTFKANNFPTLAQFEKYMQENTFDSNKIASSNGKLQGNIYMYNITIKDKIEKDTNTITKTFVMQLKEGTDFVMSFSV